MNIEVIASSSRKGSISHRVALHLRQQLGARAPQHQTGIINMQEVAFPFVQTVWHTTEHIPDEYREIALRVFNANAFIIVSPEYNGSYTPVMKNFFDHFPKQIRKTFGIATTSDGAMGGIRAAQQLLHLVPGLFGVASPFMLIVPSVSKKFAEDGSLLEETFAKSVDSFLTEFLWLSEKLAG